MPTSPRTRIKPLLVGEQNPYGDYPRFALYPAPDGCSGHRLCCLILGMRRIDYLEAFDRVNLCPGPWFLGTAKVKARALLSDPSHQRFILLGAKVCSAFGVRFEPFTTCGVRLVLPYPSGLSRAWNDPTAFRRARECVAEFAPDVAHLIGVHRE